MKKHKDFEIWLYDNDELAAVHGAKVISRELLHEWPLSVVEKITFDGSISRIYKAFNNLPVETKFYRNVKTQNIPKAFYNHSNDNRHWLLLEDAGKHYPGNLNREQTLNLAYQARKIINGLGSIDFHLYDLSEKHYPSFVNVLIGLLNNLRHNQKLKAVDEAAIARIEKALHHPEVLRATRGKCALLHGDLKCNNLLKKPDGEMIVIDWQNVLYGPEEIDIYNLMADKKMNPVSIAGIGPEILRYALAIKWLADCIDRWLPHWAEFYDGRIAETEKHIQQLVGENE
ncbi:MAG: ecdysteroid 22-kinase family protein [Defluviitaleaceae bacterium]|nr:ecdysteroid 22-kinase family protein [Defluviitaleaceae bacterium]